MLDKGADFTQLLGQTFSAAGEILGVQAAFERTEQDWNLQLAIAASEVSQIDHQVAAAREHLVAAQQDLRVLDQQVAHNEAVATFMTDKYSSASSTTGCPAGCRPRTFRRTGSPTTPRGRPSARTSSNGGRPTARSASSARPTGRSRRNGLLAAERLGLDLERLGRPPTPTPTPRSGDHPPRLAAQLDPWPCCVWS